MLQHHASGQGPSAKWYVSQVANGELANRDERQAKSLFAAVRIRTADGPPQRIKDKGQHICRATKPGLSANFALQARKNTTSQTERRGKKESTDRRLDHCGMSRLAIAARIPNGGTVKVATNRRRLAAIVTSLPLTLAASSCMPAHATPLPERGA